MEEQEKIIKLTLAAQIAAQIANKFSFENTDQDEIATNVVDLTKKIVDQLYERI